MRDWEGGDAAAADFFQLMMKEKDFLREYSVGMNEGMFNLLVSINTIFGLFGLLACMHRHAGSKNKQLKTKRKQYSDILASYRGRQKHIKNTTMPMRAEKEKKNNFYQSLPRKFKSKQIVT